VSDSIELWLLAFSFGSLYQNAGLKSHDSVMATETIDKPAKFGGGHRSHAVPPPDRCLITGFVGHPLAVSASARSTPIVGADGSMRVAVPLALKDGVAKFTNEVQHRDRALHFKCESAN